MSKHPDVTKIAAAGKSRPMDDTEAEGIVGGVSGPPAAPEPVDTGEPVGDTGSTGGPEGGPILD